MVDALTFYKDLNELVAESEYSDSEIFCEHLNAFIQERDAKMQTEVLQTDKLEKRLSYLENELRKYKEMHEKIHIPQCNIVYTKQIQLNIDGEV